MSSDVPVFVPMLAAVPAALMVVAAVLRRFASPRYSQGARPSFSRGYLL